MRRRGIPLASTAKAGPLSHPENVLDLRDVIVIYALVTH
jgi:hypothetical protein